MCKISLSQPLVLSTISHFTFGQSFTNRKTQQQQYTLPWTWSQLPQLRFLCLCNKSTQFFIAVANARERENIPNRLYMKGFNLIYWRTLIWTVLKLVSFFSTLISATIASSHVDVRIQPLQIAFQVNKRCAEVLHFNHFYAIRRFCERDIFCTRIQKTQILNRYSHERKIRLLNLMFIKWFWNSNPMKVADDWWEKEMHLIIMHSLSLIILLFKLKSL